MLVEVAASGRDSVVVGILRSWEASGDYVHQLENENAELRMERDVLTRSVVLGVEEATP
ncbi:MAG TPA: hypothetical protein VF711_04270 [Acidimicrobiales bacterium]